MKNDSGIRTMRTIGVLSGWPIYGNSGLNPFSELLLKGIKDAATLHKCNLLISSGDNPIEAVDFWPRWNYPLPKAEFLPIGAWNTDGLIMTLPCSERMKSHIRQIKEQGHPVLTWGLDVGSPCVVVDNEAGIRMALDHLYEHGHRKIAFIAGHATDTGDSLSRMRAYQRWMAEKGLPVDPRQIVYGLFNEQGGQRAFDQLLSSQVEFSAILASNDQSAIGAMLAIEKAGLKVPDDVAVIGFDNQAESLAQVPPLTTVSCPLYHSGRLLLQLLLAHIQGETIPDVTNLPVELAVRQSCGCLPQIVKSMENVHGPDWPIEISRIKVSQDQIVTEMILALKMTSFGAQSEEYSLWCHKLIESFSRSVKERNGNYFQKSLLDILRRSLSPDRETDGLQEAFSVLREHIPDLIYPQIPIDQQYLYAEDLLHQARAMISENAKTRYNRNLVQEKRNAEALGELSTLLFSTLEEAQVFQVLQEQLASVGIRHAQIVFFETGKNEDDPVAWGVIKRPGEEPAELRFLCKHFPPHGLYSEEEPFHLALLPLIAGEDDMGFIAFDAGNMAPCAGISRATAAAIRSARLYARVHELSITDPLTGLYNRRSLMDLFKKEIERSLRNRRPLAVIMLDIDHFKLYNDTFGHPAGDEALRRVTECLRQGARRSTDIIARYGGEEFSIILSETDLEGAWLVAETIRAFVSECPGLQQKLTISLGISMFQENEYSGNECSVQENEVSANICIEQADQALYFAKENGRNRTWIFGRSGPLTIYPHLTPRG
jgi:diguanylate cyclase (GGDEF)-like protein